MKRWICALATVTLIAVPALQTDAAREAPTDPSWAEKSRMQRLGDELLLELEPHAADPALDSLFVENSGQNDFDLIVVGDNNPLISDECYKLALLHATVRLSMKHPELSPVEAMTKGIDHVRNEREKAGENGRTYGDFFRHVVQCEDWCEPMVVSLEQCHIEAVAALRPWPIFFEYNSAVVPDTFDSEFARVLEEMSGRDSARVLLVGRGSRDGDKVYNRLLSRSRAEAVRDQLTLLGVDPGRIDLLWFGWEPPQISEEIARAYAISDAYLLHGARDINHSVMIVVYEGKEPIAANL